MRPNEAKKRKGGDLGIAVAVACDWQSGVGWAWPESEGCSFWVGCEGGAHGAVPRDLVRTVRGWVGVALHTSGLRTGEWRRDVLGTGKGGDRVMKSLDLAMGNSRHCGNRWLVSLGTRAEEQVGWLGQAVGDRSLRQPVMFWKPSWKAFWGGQASGCALLMAGHGL